MNHNRRRRHRVPVWRLHNVTGRNDNNMAIAAAPLGTARGVGPARLPAPFWNLVDVAARFALMLKYEGASDDDVNAVCTVGGGLIRELRQRYGVADSERVDEDVVEAAFTADQLQLADVWPKLDDLGARVKYLLIASQLRGFLHCGYFPER